MPIHTLFLEKWCTKANFIDGHTGIVRSWVDWDSLIVNFKNDIEKRFPSFYNKVNKIVKKNIPLTHKHVIFHTLEPSSAVYKS